MGSGADLETSANQVISSYIYKQSNSYIIKQNTNIFSTTGAAWHFGSLH